MHPILPVTPACPELFNDPHNKWREIGEEYWQTDEKDGICLEIHHIETGFRWWLYDAQSPEPALAVMESEQNAATLAAALADAYDYFDGYDRESLFGN